MIRESVARANTVTPMRSARLAPEWTELEILLLLTELTYPMGVPSDHNHEIEDKHIGSLQTLHLTTIHESGLSTGVRVAPTESREDTITTNM